MPERKYRPIPWSVTHPYCVSCGQESRIWWCLSCQESVIHAAAIQAISEWRAQNPWVQRRC